MIVQNAVLTRDFNDTLNDTVVKIKSAFPNRSASAVMKKVSEYRLVLKLPGKHVHYTKQELGEITDAVKSNPSMSISQIAEMVHSKLPHRTKKALIDKILGTGLRPHDNHQTTVVPSQKRPLCQNQQYPLVKLLYLLDDARHNDDAWNNIYTRAITVVGNIYDDIDTYKGRMENMKRKQHQVDNVVKLAKRMDDIESEAALGKLVEQ
jgi:hypothetical protein